MQHPSAKQEEDMFESIKTKCARIIKNNLQATAWNKREKHRIHASNLLQKIFFPNNKDDIGEGKERLYTACLEIGSALERQILQRTNR